MSELLSLGLHRLPIITRHRLQMFRGCLVRGLDVVCCDRLEHCFMTLVGVTHGAAHRCPYTDLPLVHQPFRQCGVQRGKNRISRNLRERIVKREVRLRERHGVANRFFVLRQRQSQAIDLLRGGVPRRITSQAAFKERAGFLEIGNALRAR